MPMLRSSDLRISSALVGLLAVVCGSIGNARVAAAEPVRDGPAIERSGELVNPDGNAMVLLYYQVAGLPVPVDRFVEADQRVKYASPMDKGARRQDVAAEVEAATAAVRGVGLIRLSLRSADLSEYDPTYEEFSVQALSPGSTIPFDGFGQKVALRFANGKSAQVWRVPKAEVQQVLDKMSSRYGVAADVLLKVTGAQPAPGGGTITTDVLEYELRDGSNGVVVGRVTVAAK